jgi:hypothetical protein
MSSFNKMMQIARGRIVKRSTIDCLGILMLLVSVTGCAKPDWIESMLVTVDVTGTWAGVWTRGEKGMSVGGGQAEVILQQVGPNVTGRMTISGRSGSTLPGLLSLPQNAQLQGTVKGDVVRLSGSGVEFRTSREWRANERNVHWAGPGHDRSASHSYTRTTILSIA